MQWEQRRRRTGLCSFTSYYVGRPSMRVVDETYSETVFELQPDQIKARAPLAPRQAAAAAGSFGGFASFSLTACSKHASRELHLSAVLVLAPLALSALHKGLTCLQLPDTLPRCAAGYGSNEERTVELAGLLCQPSNSLPAHCMQAAEQALHGLIASGCTCIVHRIIIGHRAQRCVATWGAGTALSCRTSPCICWDTAEGVFVCAHVRLCLQRRQEQHFMDASTAFKPGT